MIFTQGEGGTTKEISYLIAPLYIFRSVNNFFIFDVGRDDFCTDGPAAGPHWVLREVARAWEASVSEAMIATEPLLRRVIYVVFHVIGNGIFYAHARIPGLPTHTRPTIRRGAIVFVQGKRPYKWAAVVFDRACLAKRRKNQINRYQYFIQYFLQK